MEVVEENLNIDEINLVVLPEVEEEYDNLKAQQTIKRIQQRAKQLSSLLATTLDEIWERSEDGFLDTSGTLEKENQALVQKRDRISKELDDLNLSVKRMQDALYTTTVRQGEEYKRLEQIQKMVQGHYKAIDNVAKLSIEGNEAKMIHGFTSYCKGQVEPAHRRDVVVKLLAMCLKDDTRKDTFLATLSEQTEFEAKIGNLS